MIKVDDVRFIASEPTGFRDSVAALVLLSTVGHVGAVLWAASGDPNHEMAVNAGGAIVMEVTVVAGPAQESPGEKAPLAKADLQTQQKEQPALAEPIDQTEQAPSIDRMASADRRAIPEAAEPDDQSADLPPTVTAVPIPLPRPAQPKPAQKNNALPLERPAPSDETSLTEQVATVPLGQTNNERPSNQTSGESGAGMLGAAPQADNPAPSYPASARRRGHEGKVLLLVEVLTNGDAGEIILEKSSGYRSLDKAALDTVRKWRFRPARRNGHPTTATVQVPIRFALN